VSLDGPGFYDNDPTFAVYSKRRNRPDSPNQTLELPVVAALLGDPTGQDFLDLGCGDGQFGEVLLAARASSYHGIDGSQNMVSAATARLSGTPGVVQQARLENLSLPAARFSRVSARLVLHYLADLAPLLSEVTKALTDNGLLVFSVEHPVITSSDLAATESGLREHWIVDNYFDTGPRTTKWMGAEVVKHHRTVEDYFAAVQSAGLRVEALREAAPQAKHFTDDELFRRRCRIPLFLIIAARKPPLTDA
jgi:SAM-dependent methyltransferase